MWIELGEFRDLRRAIGNAGENEFLGSPARASVLLFGSAPKTAVVPIRAGSTINMRLVFSEY